MAATTRDIHSPPQTNPSSPSRPDRDKTHSRKRRESDEEDDTPPSKKRRLQQTPLLVRYANERQKSFMAQLYLELHEVSEKRPSTVVDPAVGHVIRIARIGKLFRNLPPQAL